MFRRLAFSAIPVCLLVAATAGCSSRQSAPVQQGPILVVNPALVASPDMSDVMAFETNQRDLEMRWLASRNDVQQIPQTGTPEVADPGAYVIVTRDHQRTNNGRPWNHWSSQTRIYERGSGR